MEAVVAATGTIRLTREVEDLRRRRDELVALHFERLLNSGRQDHLVITVLEYYETFRRGYLTPYMHDIFQYITSRIESGVFQFGLTGLGVDAWLDQWQRYTDLFPSIAIRVRTTSTTHLVDPAGLVSITDPSVTTCLVQAQGWVGGVISRRAIATILPHVCHREDLLSKLVGKPLDCPVNLQFYFNGAGRIVRIDLNADFLQAFRNVDGVGLVDLAHIMEHARIGENSMLPAASVDDSPLPGRVKCFR